VVLGFDSLETYKTNGPYFGCIVGRVANRIAGGSFTLDGETFTLAKNNGPNCLHGGLDGFNKRTWTASEVEAGVCFSLVSADGDEGFPGELTCSATYQLRGNRLELVMSATASKATPVNLAQHAYFNLAGHPALPGGEPASMPTVDDHVVRLRSDLFTPVDRDLIPTGERAPTAGTAMDFSAPAALGPRLRALEQEASQAAADEAASSGGSAEAAAAMAAAGPVGFDHNFELRKAAAAGAAALAGSAPGGSLQLAAVVSHPNGRTLTVETNAPGDTPHCRTRHVQAPSSTCFLFFSVF
jgi:aldose 1-epimerase